MPKAKRFSITTESYESLHIRRTATPGLIAECARCGQIVEMIAFDAAVTATGRTAFELLDAARSGEIHLQQSPTGHLVLCRNVLRIWARTPRRPHGEVQ